MRIYAAKNYQGMSRKAANIVSAQVIIKPNSVLGLATGDTPLGMYRQLVEWYRKGDLNFAEVRTVNLDEYQGLDEDNPHSYHSYMQENLFSLVNLQKDNTYLPDGLATSAEEECCRYNKVIESLGGVDLQVLGIGDNGHIGFNEPGSAFERETHLVELLESTRKANCRYFTNTQMPTHAYTMGIKSIMQAKRIVLLASGKKKAQALYLALQGPIVPSLPASILQLHNDVSVVADQDALLYVSEKIACHSHVSELGS